MILREISLQNWRSFEGKHTFSFNEGLNILVGENEAGKSTVLEALWRGLFDRHTSVASEIRDIQPEGTSLAPQVEISFIQAGKEYKLSKRFINRPSAELREKRGGSFKLIHEDDRADAKAIELVGGTATAKGVSKERHRGLAQALWHLQNEPPLPEDAWNDAVRNSLGDIVRRLSETPLEEQIAARVESDYDDIYTPQAGRLKENSELSVLGNRIVEAQNQLNQLRTREEITKGLRGSLDEATHRIASLEAQIQVERERLERAQLGAAEGRELESRLALMMHELESQKLEQSTVQLTLEGIRRRDGEAESLREKMVVVQSELSRTEVALRSVALAREKDRHEWQSVLEPSLKETEVKLRGLLSLERRSSLHKELTRLRSFTERRDALIGEIEKRRDALDDLKAPDGAEMALFQRSVEVLTQAEARAGAMDIRISFRLLDSSRKITHGPGATLKGEEYSVERPTAFMIEGVGEMEVRGGREHAEEERRAIEQAETLVREVMDRHGVHSRDELLSLALIRKKGEEELHALMHSLEIMTAGEQDADAEYAQTERLLEEENEKSGTPAGSQTDADMSKVREMADVLAAEKESLIASIAMLQHREEEAEGQGAEMIRKRVALSGTMSEMQARILVLSEENARALTQYGSLQMLEGRVSALSSSARDLLSATEEIRADCATRTEGPIREMSEAEGNLSLLLDNIRKLELSMVRDRTMIEAVVGEQLHSRISDAESELVYLLDRERTLRRRANGLRLLRDAIATQRRMRSAELAGPVTRLVNSWFRYITGDGYNSVEMNQDILPTGAMMPEGGSMPLRNMSFGTREQLVFLVRLAMGVLASGAERDLIVMDDRLVNADDERLRRMYHLLEEASASCQILFASCHSVDSAKEAKRIRIPQEGIIAENGGRITEG